MGTNYIAPIWRMPRNANKDKLSNYSIDFDGSNYIDLGDPDSLSFGNGSTDSPFSISAWINMNNNSLFRIVNKYDTKYEYQFDVLNGVLRFYLLTDPYVGYRGKTGSTLSANQWYHVVATYDGRGGSNAQDGIELYVNGQNVVGSPDVNNSYTAMSNTNAPVYIGRVTTTYANGQIDEVAIFDYALDSDQINYLYNLNNPMAITGGEPIAYLPLGDNSNPNADAGYPNISVGADSVFEFSTQDNIESPHIDMTGAMSISGWFKTTDTGYNMIYHEDEAIRTGGNRNWFFTTQSNDLRFSQFYSNGTFSNVSSSGITVNDGNWHHGVFVWDGTTNADSMKIFVDGILRGKTTASSTNRNNHNVTGMIGSSNVNYTMIGELSNIQIWDANLTYGTVSNLGDIAGEQVAELYNNGQPLMSGTQPQEANLKAWYKLNQYDSYWDLGGNGKWTFNNAAIN